MKHSPAQRAAGRKKAWTWQVAKWAAFVRIVGGMWPWLGQRRRAKAYELLFCPPKRVLRLYDPIVWSD